MTKSRKAATQKATNPTSDAGDDRAPESRSGFPIVGIGASAGGLEAFTQLIGQLPPGTGMAFVLVQHLDPGHESALTQILARATPLQVVEITDQRTIAPDHVYVIPPNTELTVEQRVLKLQPRRSGRMPHRPIDTFFESLAIDQRELAIGVVLSGTATDGTLGLEAIKAEGGITFAQDDSARHDSMPRSAIAAGCVDLVLPPTEIARELARIARHPFLAGRPIELRPSAEENHSDSVAHEDDATPLPSGGKGSPPTGAIQARRETARARGWVETPTDDAYRTIMTILGAHCGVDFTLYKSSTIRRRIHRRMLLTRQDSLEGYARWLRGNVPELDSLFSDVLISVTSFFRNPDAFETVRREVLPKLLAQPGDDPIRYWVLGCSTGQEAYSLAIAFVEAAEQLHSNRRLQVFATDLNDRLLEKARIGLYSRSLAQDISPERLRRYFVEEEGGYRISKMIREMVVFARQNLVSDPPFSRMDLISCRNLLIYLEPSLQKRALPTFHYALKPGGFLMLGSSESIGEFTHLFETVDQKHRIYARKSAPLAAFPLPGRTEPGTRTPMAGRVRSIGQPVDLIRSELTAQREADRIAIQQFAPPSVLINEDLQILQFRGPTGAYLEPPAGKASFDVVKMAREGLMLPLRAAIQKAQQEGKPARAENVSITRDGVTRAIDVSVIPLQNLAERCYLVVFMNAGETAEPTASRPDAPALSPNPDQRSRRVGELEAELTATREYLQSIQEQHEAASEELQGANEEVQSANEELQSINEELETSKEELESTNEELITVNEEMSHRNIELSRLNDDLVNFQASTKLAILLLARDLTVRRFSQMAEKQYGLRAADVGRPIAHVRHGLQAVDDAGVASAIDLEVMGTETIDNVREQEREIQDAAGRWHSLRLRPYLTNDGRVDGVVLVLHDIDAMKRREQDLIEKELKLREVHVALQSHADELARFNTMAVGRELRMIELKHEINALCRRVGEPDRYALEFEQEGQVTDD